MGFLWFGTRKNAQKLQPPPPPQSQRSNIFSSKSRSTKRSSPRARRKYSPTENIVSVDYSNNCPLPSVAELENVFKTFDADADGKISSTEMRELMGSLGHHPSEEEVDLVMKEADYDGDGFVDLSEFVALNTEGVDSAAALNDLKDAFRMFDMDGNGVICAEELHSVLRRMGEGCSMAECRNMIGGVDSDGDGQVSFHEFFAMMTTPLSVT